MRRNGDCAGTARLWPATDVAGAAPDNCADGEYSRRHRLEKRRHADRRPDSDADARPPIDEISSSVLTAAIVPVSVVIMIPSMMVVVITVAIGTMR